MIIFDIQAFIQKTLTDLGISEGSFGVEHPADLSHGDFSTNVALIVGKKENKNPKEVAEQIKTELEKNKPDFIESIDVAGPGFINFHLSGSFFENAIKQILKEGNEFGNNKKLLGQKTIVEYTDPNPFKEFHIGHLMSNTVGEALSRIIEAGGGETKRACYQGDVGLHVAKAVAQKLDTKIDWKNVKDVATSYVMGAKRFETEENFPKFVLQVNKDIYQKQNDEVSEAYDLGRKLTLEYFDILYKKLGSHFDFFFFESTTGEFGKALVHENKDVFEESEGAIIYRGEVRDPKLHTRVFINKEGLPTYEAKELGLAKIKYDTYPYDISIVITGNEINDYFKVLLSAMGEIFPELAKRTKHISHGMLRLPTGKMSSRTGDVITAEWLIDEAKKKVKEKLDASDREIADKEELAEQVAIAAIKYSILKQAPGKDIIFDLEKSISFEGDSGPYLQYTYARALSVIEKFKKEIGELPKGGSDSAEKNTVSQLLYRFPEIVEKALSEYSPHFIILFLIELASAFNSFYAHNQIVNSDDLAKSRERILLTQAVSQVLKNGLHILGISAPEKM